MMASLYRFLAKWSWTMKGRCLSRSLSAFPMRSRYFLSTLPMRSRYGLDRCISIPNKGKRSASDSS